MPKKAASVNHENQTYREKHCTGLGRLDVFTGFLYFPGVPETGRSKVTRSQMLDTDSQDRFHTKMGSQGQPG